MNIEQIFVKELTRDINGVVKAEQVDNKSVFIELDEYVITKELDRHFRSFFETYVPAVRNRNAAMSGKVGVWVSGFFGSGKSHFIKILSYLLENRQVEKDGHTRHAIDFFKDKISDPMLLADIQIAVSKPTDVILFNIDSRANTDERENAILKVFLKVFNERVDARIEKVKTALNEASASSDLTNKALYPLQQIKSHIDKTSSIPQIMSEQVEAESCEDKAHELINEHIVAERKRTEAEAARLIQQAKAKGETNPAPPAAPAVPAAKQTITINLAQVRIHSTGSDLIESEADVETYLRQLREQLLRVIRAGDKVRLK